MVVADPTHNPLSPYYIHSGENPLLTEKNHHYWGLSDEVSLDLEEQIPSSQRRHSNFVSSGSKSRCLGTVQQLIYYHGFLTR